MPIFDNIGGVQRKVAKSYSNINGGFREDNKVFDNVNGVWRETHSSGLVPTLLYKDHYHNGYAGTVGPTITVDSTGITFVFDGNSNTTKGATMQGTALFRIDLPSSMTFSAASDLIIDSLKAVTVINGTRAMKNVHLLLYMGTTYGYIDNDHSAYDVLTDRIGLNRLELAISGTSDLTAASIPVVMEYNPFTTTILYFELAIELYANSSFTYSGSETTLTIPNGAIRIHPNAENLTVVFQ